MRRSEAATTASHPFLVSSEGHGKRILVVDDNDLIRRVVRTFLERLGYVCGEAAVGAEALKEIKDSKPDLVVMDLVMPGMNGLEATTVIRSTMPSCRSLRSRCTRRWLTP